MTSAVIPRPVQGRVVLLTFWLALLWSGPAGAQTSPPPDAQEDTAADLNGDVTYTEGVIDAEDESPPDSGIDERLTDIFGALPAFRDVSVDVTDGVVALTGTVPNRQAIEDAEALASRIAGVVAVENGLAPDLSVDRQLGPLAARSRALLADSVAFLPLLGVATAIIVLFWILGSLAARATWLWQRIGPNILVASVLGSIARLVLLALGLVIALSILDAVAVLSAVLGAAGVIGLAVGFAVRDTIENFIASIMLSLRQPFRARDFVDIDGREGHVVQLTSRATILLTPNGNHLRIPNAQVFKAIITNFSRNPERRFTFALGIDAADDPEAAIALGVETLRGLAFVLADPPPLGWIVEVGDSNIVLSFAPFVDQRETDFLKAQSAAIAAVKDALEADGFTLPEPIYRLRIDQVPGWLTVGEAAVPQGPAGAPPSTQPRRRATTPQDVTPDQALERKVEEDRARSGADDLLSGEAPTEFGDEAGDKNSPA